MIDTTVDEENLVPFETFIFCWGIRILSLILIINDYYIVRPLPYPLMHDSVYEHLWTVWGHTKHERLILRSWWLNDACPSHLPWIPTRHLWRWKSWLTIAEDLPWLPWGSWSLINTHDDPASDGKGLQQWQTVKHLAGLGVPVPKLFNIQLRKFLSISDRWHMLIWYDMIWYDLYDMRQPLHTLDPPTWMLSFGRKLAPAWESSWWSYHRVGATAIFH